MEPTSAPAPLAPWTSSEPPVSSACGSCVPASSVRCVPSSECATAAGAFFWRLRADAAAPPSACLDDGTAELTAVGVLEAESTKLGDDAASCRDDDKCCEPAGSGPAGAAAAFNASLGMMGVPRASTAGAPARPGTPAVTAPCCGRGGVATCPDSGNCATAEAATTAGLAFSDGVRGSEFHE